MADAHTIITLADLDRLVRARDTAERATVRLSAMLQHAERERDQANERWELELARATKAEGEAWTYQRERDEAREQLRAARNALKYLASKNPTSTWDLASRIGFVKFAQAALAAAQTERKP